MEVECRVCGGAGVVHEDDTMVDCYWCGGAGAVEETEVLEPAGTYDVDFIRNPEKEVVGK